MTTTKVRTVDSLKDTVSMWDIIARFTIWIVLGIGGFVVAIKLDLNNHDLRLGTIERELASRTLLLQGIAAQLTEIKVAIGKLETKVDRLK